MISKISTIVAAVSLAFLLALAPASKASAEVKIGTISIQEIITKSKAGIEAQKKLETKANELEGKLKSEQDQLEAMRQEIEKKSSVWSAEVRGDKERDYQKMLREFQMKSEDAQYELKQLDSQIMGPILKNLHEVIAEVGKKNGYTIILENTMKGIRSRIGLMYADDGLDISDLVLQELDKRMPNL